MKNTGTLHGTASTFVPYRLQSERPQWVTLVAAQNKSAWKIAVESEQILPLITLSLEAAALTQTTASAGGALPTCLLQLPKWPEWKSWIAPTGKVGHKPLILERSGPFLFWAAPDCQSNAPIWMGLAQGDGGHFEANPKELSDHSPTVTNQAKCCWTSKVPLNQTALTRIPSSRGEIIRDY